LGPHESRRQNGLRVGRVKASDIDVAQTHDCFTISELIEAEELGFCKKGEGGPFVAAGETDIGGRIPINTDGGLLGVGHPSAAPASAKVWKS